MGALMYTEMMRKKHPRDDENPEIKTIRDAHRMRGHFSML
jgi:hypothetical protein